MSRAANIIRNEHRAIAAVLHGLKYFAREAQASGTLPDFALLSLMLDYIDGFPEMFHHPKEDRYLFPAVRRRAPEMAATIDELEREHSEGAELIRELRRALWRYRDEGGAGLPAFAAAVNRYTEFHWSHMRKEEDQILAVAERALSPADWRPIDAAFQANADPLFGEARQRQFDRLFSQIVRLAPPPIGVGPAQPQ